MRSINVVSGRACPVDADNVDTDQILPKQFLKRTERTGFGPYAFYEWRYEADGAPKLDFPMNMPEHAGAAVLLTGRNFGCGSSREHAPWALEDAGFRAIVAPSFADIFRTNCAKVGVVAVQLDDAVVRRLFDLVAADPAIEVTVRLRQQRVTAPSVGGLVGVEASFHIDPHTRRCLLEGLDDIALTLAHESDIRAHESARPSYKPTLSSGTS